MDSAPESVHKHSQKTGALYAGRFQSWLRRRAGRGGAAFLHCGCNKLEPEQPRARRMCGGSFWGGEGEENIAYEAVILSIGN